MQAVEFLTSVPFARPLYPIHDRMHQNWSFWPRSKGKEWWLRWQLRQLTARYQIKVNVVCGTVTCKICIIFACNGKPVPRSNHQPLLYPASSTWPNTFIPKAPCATQSNVTSWEPCHGVPWWWKRAWMSLDDFLREGGIFKSPVDLYFFSSLAINQAMKCDKRHFQRISGRNSKVGCFYLHLICLLQLGFFKLWLILYVPASSVAVISCDWIRRSIGNPHNRPTNRQPFLQHLRQSAASVS